MSFLHAAILAALAVVSASPAFAHCFVGARFFPATLATDDPCVADELSLPTITAFSTGDVPPSNQVDVSGELSKRITETVGFSIGSTWSSITPPGQPTAQGFQNLETTFKWQMATLARSEFVMSAGIGIEWGGTGAQAVGAEIFNIYTPTIWFGKGFGQLPDSLKWLRPLAVTGQVGYAVPGIASTVVAIDPDTGDTDTDFHPQVLRWGGSVQYSMPYLKANVVDLGLSDFFNHMNLIVEASMQTPVANTLTSGILTTGTINPGIIWTGSYLQFGIEMVIPVNLQSGADVGVIAQLHIYLDDLFPRSIGKPLFASTRRAMGY